MTNRLRCPECGCEEFSQDRSMVFDESVIAKFNSIGEVDDEYIEDSECSGEDSAGPYRCRCGWLLIDENQNPITEPDDVVAAFEAATLARLKKIGKPTDIPDDPKAYYSMTGEWRGWRDFLGVPDDSPICDECGDHPCECSRQGEQKNRNEIIEELVDRHSDTLNDLTDEELLGEGAIEKLREDAIERLIELYRESLENSSDEEVLGDDVLEELREEKLDALLGAYQAELESKSDDELLGGQDESKE